MCINRKAPGPSKEQTKLIQAQTEAIETQNTLIQEQIDESKQIEEQLQLEQDKDRQVDINREFRRRRSQSQLNSSGLFSGPSNNQVSLTGSLLRR